MDEHTTDDARGPADDPGRAEAPEIDLAQLAERVYRLLREEIRLERAREGRRMRRGGI